ncbi:kelch repeat-containing protein [Sorangium sp. So ce1153]|uniref:kelch repeat-containing protein n=1 Tax=Sorangium sp. So ce1153 TaxID=3133333 RepID=UPI003F5EE2FA
MDRSSDIPAAGSTRRPGSSTLALLWSGLLALLLGCSEAADPLDARALRRQFPEQASAILEGPLAFALASDSFEALGPSGAPAGLSGEAAQRPRFPRGGGALQLPLPDGSEAFVRELGALGEAVAVEGAVTYPRRGGTSFWTALEDGYEEWLLLEPSAVRRDAPVATWKVDGAALRQAGDAVEVADARGAPQIRVTAPEAYGADGRPVGARLVAQGERIELWVEAEGETVLVDPRWKLKRDMNAARLRHATTPLKDGRILVVGGNGTEGTLDSAEVFDPASGTWLLIEPMGTARAWHTATLLADGRVLVAGGLHKKSDGFYEDVASAELLDPASGAWSWLMPMPAARSAHTATLLADGRVLVAGGFYSQGDVLEKLASVEVFDPASGMWSQRRPMLTARSGHTATLLADGQVLVAGGETEGGEALASAEVFDPASGAWRAVEPMHVGRAWYTATLLTDGRVLVVGGDGGQDGPESAEIFDPGTQAWQPVGPMLNPRMGHTATLLMDGRVLVAGGSRNPTSLDSAEVFDPASGAWRFVEPMRATRWDHTAAPLPDGRVLVAGGDARGGGLLSKVEVFDPESSTWLPARPMLADRTEHTATTLLDGRVLVAGGRLSRADVLLGDAELFNPASGAWLLAASMNTARTQHTATLLWDGRVLVVGGQDIAGELRGAELFDPASGVWSPSLMHTLHTGHTATLLRDGRVLVAGGYGPSQSMSGRTELLDRVEVFDPGSGMWEPAVPMLFAREQHSATLLSDGRVLVAGGAGATGVLDTAEVFDPASGTWLPVAPMLTTRSRHTATSLRDGRVLVTGGFGGAEPLDSAEVFDPASGTWLPVAPMLITRVAHTATLLPDGRMLVTGGTQLGFGERYLDSAEAFDPASGTWLPLGPMLTTRAHHTATLVSDGRVLVVGGDSYDPAPGAEVFRPMPGGSICASDVECESGSCTDDVCCDQRCNIYLCEACSEYRGGSADGVCTSLHPDYAPFACSPQTGRRTSPCDSVHDCIDGFVCDASGDCIPPPPNGGYLDDGGCGLAAPARDPAAPAPLELGLLVLSALSAALRRRRR